MQSGCNRLIEQRIAPEKRLPVFEADAVRFACNAVNVGKQVVVNQVSPELRGRLEAAGFEVRETPLTEFLKSGGGAKCLTLRLTEPKPPRYEPGLRQRRGAAFARRADRLRSLSRDEADE
jgi:hypothetical protein